MREHGCAENVGAEAANEVAVTLLSLDPADRRGAICSTLRGVSQSLSGYVVRAGVFEPLAEPPLKPCALCLFLPGCPLLAGAAG